VDNLLSNAIKFSEHQSKIAIQASIENERAIISIRDSGPGFSDEDKQFLFQRFKKLSARPTGGESSNGLGLAIVKTLVDRLHGEIELKSALGEGAEFIVTIPQAGPPAQ
jgi:signal transduction histidine kinase